MARDEQTEDRIVILESMDRIMRRADDESIILDWLAGGIPDWNDKDVHDLDLRSIASDDDSYREVWKCFVQLFPRIAMG